MTDGVSAGVVVCEAVAEPLGENDALRLLVKVAVLVGAGVIVAD